MAQTVRTRLLVLEVCSRRNQKTLWSVVMNERIKDLAQKAGIWKQQPPHFTNTSNPIDFPVNVNANLEKFAELILADIDKIIGNRYRATPPGYADILLSLNRDIKKHFYTDENNE